MQIMSFAILPRPPLKPLPLLARAVFLHLAAAASASHDFGSLEWPLNRFIWFYWLAAAAERFLPLKFLFFDHRDEK